MFAGVTAIDGWAQIHEMKQVSAARANCIWGHFKMFLHNNVNLVVSINGGIPKWLFYYGKSH